MSSTVWACARARGSRDTAPRSLDGARREEVSLAFTGQIERLEARIAMLEARISQPTPERARNCTVRRHNPLGKADAGVVVTVDASMDFPLFKMRCGDALGVTCAKLRKADR